MSSESLTGPGRPADEYGHSRPSFTVHLVVRDLERSARFYMQVLTAELLFRNQDVVALRLLGVVFRLCADHNYDQHPWRRLLKDRLRKRGTGAELRLFGMDPDELERRARRHHAAVLKKAWDTPQGWREVSIADPDGYLWAVGAATPKSSG